MASLEKKQEEGSKRISRYFSEAFKRKIVGELDKKLISVSDVCTEYQVSSPAVYKWIYKYSLMRKKSIRMVVEADSDTAKLKAMRAHIADLERLLGQKQFEIDFVNKQMELAGEQYGVDLKKKVSGQHSSGSGSIENNTTTK